MAISVVGTPTTFAGGAAGTSVTGTVPNGVADGDFLIWSIAGNVTGIQTTPTGWTVLQTHESVTGASLGRTVYYRWAASEPVSYTATVAASGWTGEMIALRGVDIATPLDVTPTLAQSSSGPAVSPAITSVTAGAVILALQAATTPSGITTSAWSSTNLTLDGSVSSTRAAAINCVAGMGHFSQVAVGTFTPDFTVTGSNTAGLALTLAIRPAGSSVGTGAAALSGSGSLGVVTTPAPTQTAALTGSGALVALGPNTGAFLAQTGQGTQGSTVSTTNSNAGSQWSLVTLSGTGTTITYDNAQTIHTHTTSIKSHLAAVASTAYLDWKSPIIATAAANSYYREYIYLTAYPTVTTRVAAMLNNTTLAASLQITTTGTIRTVNSAGSVLATSTAVIPLNQWVRIEFDVFGIVGTTGTVAARLYSGANLETTTVDTGGNLSTAAAAVAGTITDVRPLHSASVTMTTAWDVWSADHAWSDTVSPGVYVAQGSAFAAAANLSGTGTLGIAFSGLTLPGTANFSGSSSLTAVAPVSAPTFTGSGTLALSVRAGFSRTATLSGVGTLAGPTGVLVLVVADMQPGAAVNPPPSVVAGQVVAVSGAQSIIMPGDLANDGTTAQYGFFNTMYGSKKAIIDPAPGNHDYGANSTPVSDAANYHTYFGDAQSGYNTTTNSRYWYSFDIAVGPATWHFIALNSNYDSAGVTGLTAAQQTAQLTWLQADLDANTTSHIVAFFHHARWSDGTPGNDANQGAIWTKLRAANCDIVLNGHTHSYQRFPKLNTAGTADPAGIREFVVGTGGSGLFACTTNQATVNSGPGPFDNLTSQWFGYMKLTLAETSYSWDFRSQNGTSLDSGSDTTNFGASYDIALTGNGTLTILTGASRQGFATLSGSGTLTDTTTPRAAVTAPLTGSGSLSGSAGTIARVGTAGFTGTGTLVGAGASVKPFTATPGGMKYVELRKYDTSGNYVIMPDFTTVTVDVKYNDIGFLDFTYPLDLALALGLQDQVEIGVVAGFDYPTTPVEIGRYVIENTTPVESRSEERTLQCQGRHVLAYLDDAVVYPPNWLIGGTAPTAPPDHEFFDATPGTILRTLIDRAQQRGTLLNIDESTFTGLTTSAGTAWSSKLSTTFSQGTSYLAVVTQLMEMGMCDVQMDGHVLKVYNPNGVGLDNNMHVQVGEHVTQISSSTDSTETVGAVLIAGAQGTCVEETDPTGLNSPGRRRERATAASEIPDPLVLRDLAKWELQQFNVVQREDSLGISLAGSVLPFRDFDIGDWLHYDKEAADSQRLRVRQIALSVDESRAIGCGLTLNSVLQEADVKLQHQIEMWSGSGGTYGPLPNTAPADTIRPAAPIAPTLSSTQVNDKSGDHAVIYATWPAVTTNADTGSTTADDLSHYEVIWKYSTDTVWGFTMPTPGENAGGTLVTQFSWGPVDLGRTINVKVRAVDNTGNLSDWSPVGTLVISIDTTGPNTPSTPVAVSRLGALQVSWNGLDYAGGAMPADFHHLEIRYSTTNNFTFSTGTLGPTIASPYGGTAVIVGLTYSQTYYIKTVAVDRLGNTSNTPSSQTTCVYQPLVSADLLNRPITGPNISVGSITAANAVFGTAAILSANINTLNVTQIEAGTLNATITNSGVIQTAAAGARVVLDGSGLTAYDVFNVPSVTISALDGTINAIGQISTGSSIQPRVSLWNNAVLEQAGIDFLTHTPGLESVQATIKADADAANHFVNFQIYGPQTTAAGTGTRPLLTLRGGTTDFGGTYPSYARLAGAQVFLVSDDDIRIDAAGGGGGSMFVNSNRIRAVDSGGTGATGWLTGDHWNVGTNTDGTNEIRFWPGAPNTISAYGIGANNKMVIVGDTIELNTKTASDGGLRVQRALSVTDRAQLRAINSLVTEPTIIFQASQIRIANNVGDADKTLIAANLAATSDERVKKNIRSLPVGALGKLNSLRPVHYDLRDPDDDRHHVGLIAQEVAEHIPEAYFPASDEGAAALSVMPLISTLIKAVQELSVRVDSLGS